METRERFAGVNSIKFNRHFQNDEDCYLDEYHFRYNRRNNMEAIFDLLMRRMVYYEPKRLNKKTKTTAT